MKFHVQSYIILFVVCLAFIIPAAVSASPQTITLVSGTDTQSAGYVIVQPVNPLGITEYSNQGWSSAVATSWSTWYNADAAPFGSGATWISTAEIREGSYSQNQWRLFKIDFEIPAGSTISPAQLSYSVDNAVTIYLNDVEIGNTGTVFGAAPAVESYNFMHAYNVEFTPVVGSNTLKFVVRNWKNSGCNPTGLLYKAVIDYECQDTPIPAPEFPSAFLPATMIIGFMGAVFIVRRTREY